MPSTQLCLNEQCAKREECLRYQLMRHVKCASFWTIRKIRVAWGLTKFYEEMPAKTARAIHAAIEAHFSHGQYYCYRNKTIGLLPTDQKYITNICRRYGWDKPPVFDEYTGKYDWTS